MLEAPRSAIFEERLECALKLREEGNNCYNAGDFDRAISLYKRSLYHSEFDEAQMTFELLEVHVKKVHESRYFLAPLFLSLSDS